MSRINICLFKNTSITVTGSLCQYQSVAAHLLCISRVVSLDNTTSHVKCKVLRSYQVICDN